MQEGYKLGLDVWLEWKCKVCKKRKPMQDDEEWQFCCGKTMTMQPMKKFIVTKETP